MTTVMVIRYARAKELLEAELGDDLVALDVASGHCFGFNPVAADIWHLLAQPQDFDALCRELMDQYEVDRGECEADLRACLSNLETQGLVRTIEDGR
jgi:hypothetical protein